MGISVNPSCPLGGGGVLRVAEGVLGGRFSSETGAPRAMLGSEASARGASGPGEPILHPSQVEGLVSLSSDQARSPTSSLHWFIRAAIRNPTNEEV